MGGLLPPFLLLCAVAATFAADPYQPFDDVYYPAEEQAERAATQIPKVTSISADKSSAVIGGQTVKAGSQIAGGWSVKVVLSSAVVLEKDFKRWGMLVFAHLGAKPLILRKSVGEIQSIRQARFNFSAVDKDYWTKVIGGLNDYPSELAANHTSDGELTYSSLAATLAPQRDYASISNPEDAAKFVVTFNGKVKCASNEAANGITEYVDVNAPAPNKQTVVFAAKDHVLWWPQAPQKTFDHSKTGWFGSHLHIANVGQYSKTSSGDKGYAMIVFAPIGPFKPASAEEDTHTQADTTGCSYAGPFANTYVAGNARGGGTYNSLADAKAACDANLDCSGITDGRPEGKYSLRSDAYTLPSPYKETSWLVTNESKANCRSLPRQPGVIYSPGTMVRLAELGAADEKYFYAANATTANGTTSVPISATQYYTELLKHHQYYTKILDPAMTVELPDSDTRQRDMAYNALLTTMSNYVGNQSNYGNGMTYWSVGREDNGSLPLNILSVDDALLDWGMCDQALGHIGYYFDNYISPSKADGGRATQYLIDYGPWGSQGDSISDFGRLIELYLKAVRYCTDGSAAAWSTQYLPKVVMMGELLLKLRQEASSPPAPSPWSCYQFTPEEQKDINAHKISSKMVCEDHNYTFTSGKNDQYPGCGTCWCCKNSPAPPPPAPAPGTKGLLAGPPEHDFSGTTDKYFYNNQVWTVRGLESFGQYLTEGDQPVNATLGQQMLKEAIGLRSDIEASINACVVPGDSNDDATADLKFLPPFAELGFKPYKTMTESRDASYANFR
jgi:hypothetical protein